MKRRDFLGLSVAAGTVVISEPAGATHTLQHRILSLNQFITLHFCSGQPFRRQNAHALLNSNPNHPIIASYSTGVAAMKALPNTNSNNWDYQANIHGFMAGTFTGTQPSIFTSCQHFNDYFLPWHRMYLFFFEKIVRQHSGNPSFALPYWNYESAAQATLPVAFRQGGSTLYDSSRNAALNAGGILSASARTSVAALAQPNFAFSSSLENTPHGAVHIAIGGHMGNFSGAGRDPIFWLHHCNIDRLWEKWLSQGGGRTNPIANTTWMNKTSTFADVNGSFVTMRNSDVLSTVSQLNYQYDDPSKCVPLIIATQFARNAKIQNVRVVNTMNANAEGQNIAQKIKPDLSLDRVKVTSQFSIDNERLTKLFSADALPSLIANKKQVLLVFSNISSQLPVGGFYEIYLDAPDGEKLNIESPHYVGNLTTFGSDQLSRDTMNAAGKHEAMEGLNVAIDITERLKDLSARSRIKKNAFEITLVRAGVEDEKGTVAAFDSKSQLEIGSIDVQIIGANGIEK